MENDASLANKLMLFQIGHLGSEKNHTHLGTHTHTHTHTHPQAAPMHVFNVASIGKPGDEAIHTHTHTHTHTHKYTPQRIRAPMMP